KGQYGSVGTLYSSTDYPQRIAGLRSSRSVSPQRSSSKNVLDDTLTFYMNSNRGDVHWATITIESRICNELVVRANRYDFLYSPCVVRFEDSLPTGIIESAVANDEAEAASRQIRSMVSRDPVDGHSRSEHIVSPFPIVAMN